MELHKHREGLKRVRTSLSGRPNENPSDTREVIELKLEPHSQELEQRFLKMLLEHKEILDIFKYRYSQKLRELYAYNSRQDDLLKS